MEVQSVYSTSIEKNRFSVKCLTVSTKNFSLQNFLVDTGAVITCCQYRFLDKNMQEKDVLEYETRIIGGLVSGSNVKFYRYPLRQFTVGNIDMGKQDIWITFDKRVTDVILGMDILRQIILIMNPYNRKVHFCKDMMDYQENFELAIS